MNILGLYGAFDWDARQDGFCGEILYAHDAGCCLVVNGELKVAITEERLTRVKYDGNFPWNSIRYVLDTVNITAKDIDQVWIATMVVPKFVESYHKNVIQNHLKQILPNASVHIVDHHLCHASSAVLTSGFNDCMFLTLDGAGSAFYKEINGKFVADCASRATIGTYQNNKLKIFDSGFGTYTNMFGNWYSTKSIQVLYQKYKQLKLTNLPPWDFTELHRESAAGKVMGLSAYGIDKLTEMTYKPTVNKYLVEAYRMPVIEFDFKENSTFGFDHNDPDVNAADLQVSFEHYIMEYIDGLVSIDLLEENMCFAGGTFLNVLANTMIKKSGYFKNTYIPPFTNDTGMAIGAALFGNYKNKEKLILPKNIATLGRLYTNKEIEAQLKINNLSYVYYDSFIELCKIISEKLNHGKIVGWFQNRSELGPRALGSRSILMSCNKAEYKDILNERVKHREYWRPFAGVVLKEHHSNYFVEDFDSPYMLYSYTVKPHARDIIPAINHVDNTCRVQTVTQDMYPELFTLLTEYHKITNVAVLLNTSFNDNGEPIIESPSDAIKSFMNMNIDVLAIGNYVVFK